MIYLDQIAIGILISLIIVAVFIVRPIKKFIHFAGLIILMAAAAIGLAYLATLLR